MKKGVFYRMENRISVVGIILEQPQSAVEVNRLLHEYREWIVGRMGIPYKERGVSIISLILDAPPDVASALSGKLGMISGVSSKTVTAKTAK